MSINTEVQTQRFAISDVEFADYNPRQISDDALRGLRESLRDVGLLDMPVVNLKGAKPRLIGGHQRVTALKAEGYTHFDAVVVHFDEAAELTANLTLNNRSIQGSFDAVKAMPVIEAVEPGLVTPQHGGLDALFDSLRTQAARMEAGAKKATDAPAESAEPHSEPGYVYRLGKHRLVCGSFTALHDLLPKKASATITDPPYGVGYVQASTGESVENDALTGDAWTEFLAEACELIVKRTNGLCYVFMSSQEIPALQQAFESAGGRFVTWLFWEKDRFTLSRGDYHHIHEPCLFGTTAKHEPKLNGDPRPNLLQFPKPSVNDLHPTQKPVALIRALMEDATKPNDIVLEPFCGSGTTLVVAEELARVCYASELSPAHCDTIRKRWAGVAHPDDQDWVALTPGEPLG